MAFTWKINDKVDIVHIPFLSFSYFTSVWEKDTPLVTFSDGR